MRPHRLGYLIFWLTAPLGMMGLLLVFGGFWPGVALVLIGAAGFLAADQLRCPACGLGVWQKTDQPIEIHWPGDKIPDDCPRCGRSRRGIWPFQRLLKPEQRS